MRTIPRLTSGVICLFLLLILSACQTLPKPSGLEQQWRLKARVAIKTPEESVAATLIWVRDRQRSDFHLFGALGSTYVRVQEDKNGALLQLPDDQEFRGESAEQVIYRALGWSIPLHALSHWVQGKPAGLEGETTQYDERQRLQSIDYGQWHIEFDRYYEASGRLTPKIIRVTHPQLSLKLVVKSWRLA